MKSDYVVWFLVGYMIGVAVSMIAGVL